MIIDQPILQKERSDKAFEKYMDIYNADKPLGERLRGNHLEIMRLLHHFLMERMRLSRTIAESSGNFAFMKLDMDGQIKITTNNIVIAKKRKLSTRTVQRLMDRLELANVIIKIFHGRKRNISIVFNPMLLEIADGVQKDNYWKAIPDKAFSLQKMTNCRPNHVGYRNYSNKIIIHKADSNKFERLQVETDGNINGNTRKCAINSLESTKENPLGINIPPEILQEWKQNIADKKSLPPQNKSQANIVKGVYSPDTDPGKTRLNIIKANIDRQYNAKVSTAKEKLKNTEIEIKKMRRSYALLMVQIMIEYLLPKTFELHNSYFNEVVEYVTDHYFGNINSFIGIESAWTSYSSRLEDARRFKQNNPGYTPYPKPYFDKNNPKGFDNPQWHKNKRKWGKHKLYQTDQKRLMQSVRAYNKNPINEVYQQQIESLRNTVHSESTFNAFFKIVANSNGGQLPKFNNNK
ncbi:MAG: hypothetical protein QM503_05075 [Bacteroidota bacterium]